MGYKEEIYNLLQKEDLTIDQLSEKIFIKPNPEDNKNNLRVYVNRLLKDGLIKSIGNKERNRVYRSILSNSNGLLKELYDLLLSDKVKVIDSLNPQERQLITRIEEMLEIE